MPFRKSKSQSALISITVVVGLLFLSAHTLIGHSVFSVGADAPLLHAASHAAGESWVHESAIDDTDQQFNSDSNNCPFCQAGRASLASASGKMAVSYGHCGNYLQNPAPIFNACVITTGHPRAPPVFS